MFLFLKILVTLLINWTIYNTLIISLISSVVVFLIIISLNKQKVFKRNQIKKSILIVGAYLLIWGFLSNILVNQDSSILNEINLPSLKTTVIVFIEYFIKYLVSYAIPFFLSIYTLYILYKRNYYDDATLMKYILILIFLLMTTSILFSSIFHGINMDFPQSISNIVVCSFMVFYY